jgi:hypothetical protein
MRDHGSNFVEELAERLLGETDNLGLIGHERRVGEMVRQQAVSGSTGIIR